MAGADRKAAAEAIRPAPKRSQRPVDQASASETRKRLELYRLKVEEILETLDELRAALAPERLNGRLSQALDAVAEAYALLSAIEVKAKHARELADWLLDDEIPAGKPGLGYISLATAASVSGLSMTTLRNQIHRGRLKAEKIGRNWLTTPGWLFDYLKSRRGYRGPLREIVQRWRGVA